MVLAKAAFILLEKPFSVNRMYYGGTGHTKTTAAHEWSQCILEAIGHEAIQEQFSALRKAFDPKSTEFVIRLTAEYPEQMYYTKANIISSKTMDTTNWEKPLIDLLFLPKYKQRHGNIGIDDKYIVALSSKKKPGTRHCIKVQIALVTRADHARQQSPQ